MTAMQWSIKASLLGYVRGMGDGAITATDGAQAIEGGFRFEQVQEGVFRGAVTITGHGGMMRVVIADPAIVETDAGWVLEIADPDDAATRLRFATIAAFDGERATGTALTEDGADLFFGPYRRGTELDDPVIAP